MKKILLLLPLLLVVALPGSAQAKPGQLDTSFGADGRVTARVGALPSQTKAHLAWAKGGRIVAAVGSQLLEYRPEGRLEQRFGDNGRVGIKAPEDRSFLLTGLAVDSRGRILVSGTSSKSTSGELETSAVMVQRLLPSGQLDTSFGTGGTVLSDFGFPHPSHEGGRQSTDPFVVSSGLAIDAAGRAVLTGSWLSYDPSPCYYLYCYSTSKPFVVRLTKQGALDTDFAGDGVFDGSPQERAFAPTPAGNRVLFVAENVSCVDRCGGAHPTLGCLTAEGEPDPRFASAGFASLPFWESRAVAIDRVGRILLVGHGEAGGLVPLQRLNARGMPDTHFGDEGERLINLPVGGQPPQALAADQRGRPLLATDARRKKQNFLIVFRRNSRGGRDPGFGNNGQVWTQMPGWVSPTQILVGGKGKILVGGTLFEDSLFLTRYSAGG